MEKICQWQHEILSKYRQHYPQTTLKQISQQTGISQTRVHRLFNGYAMKLKEYEIFFNILKMKNNDNHYQQIYCNHLRHLRYGKGGLPWNR